MHKYLSQQTRRAGDASYSILSARSEPPRLQLSTTVLNSIHYARNAGTHTPLSHSRSLSNAGLATTVVMAFRSSWFIVTDTLQY